MSTTTPPTSGFQFGNKLYDKLKFVVQIVLPALGTLYAGLAGLWGFPNVQEVVGTITAVALFLGLLLGLSSKNFQAVPQEGTPVGTFVVTEQSDGAKTVKLDLERDPEEFIGKENITFKTSREIADPVDPEDPEDREQKLL